jgi:hypothetical protein
MYARTYLDSFYLNKYTTVEELKTTVIGALKRWHCIDENDNIDWKGMVLHTKNFKFLIRGTDVTVFALSVYANDSVSRHSSRGEMYNRLLDCIRVQLFNPNEKFESQDACCMHEDYIANVDRDFDELVDDSEDELDTFNKKYGTNFSGDDYSNFLEYVQTTKLDTADALEYCKSCHFCNSPDIKLGDEYCSEQCSNHSMFYCYKGDECLLCDKLLEDAWGDNSSDSNYDEESEEEAEEDDEEEAEKEESEDDEKDEKDEKDRIVDKKTLEKSWKNGLTIWILQGEALKFSDGTQLYKTFNRDDYADVDGLFAALKYFIERPKLYEIYV